MSAERIVGIDLGTTNSLVAFMQGIRLLSSPATTAQSRAIGRCLGRK